MNHTPPDSSDHGAHDMLLVEATAITLDGTEVPGTLVLVPHSEMRGNGNGAVFGSTEQYRKGFDRIFNN